MISLGNDCRPRRINSLACFYIFYAICGHQLHSICCLSVPSLCTNIYVGILRRFLKFSQRGSPKRLYKRRMCLSLDCKSQLFYKQPNSIDCIAPLYLHFKKKSLLSMMIALSMRDGIFQIKHPSSFPGTSQVCWLANALLLLRPGAKVCQWHLSG